MAFSNKYLNIYSSNETRKNKFPISLIVAFVYIYFKISKKGNSHFTFSNIN